MTSTAGFGGASDGQERRALPRIRASSVPHLTAHIAGGPQARLIDLSKRGVRIESPLHMGPGSRVVLRFVLGEESVTVTGDVMRSVPLMRLSSGEVAYDTALAFTEELTLCSDEFEDAGRAAGLSCGSSHPSDPPDFTMIVMDGRSGAPLRAGGDAPC